MSFQLLDINSAQAAPPKPSVKIGALLVNSEGQFFGSDGSACWTGNDYRDLPGGLVWITSHEYQEARRIAGSYPGKQTRSNNWMRSKLSSWMLEWNIEGETEASARLLGQLSNRVFLTANEVLMKQLPPNSRDWAVNLGSQPSLSTALYEALATPWKKGEPTELLDAIRNALKTGAMIPGRKGSSADTIWNFQSSRLSHARKVAATPTPAGGWKVVQLNGMDVHEFVRNLVKSGLPALVCVDAHGASRDLPQTLQPWFTATRGGGRFWLTGIELLAMPNLDGLKVESAYLAQAESTAGNWKTFLDGLSTLNGEAVEFQKLSLPSLSWSVGMLAENLIAASWRYKDDKPDFAPAFYAAQDNIVTEKRARVMAEAGVSVLQYFLGGVIAQVSRDPESVLVAADAAWRAGLFLPSAFVELGRKLGIRMAGRPEDWGGDPEDLFMARLIAAGRKDIRWEFDQVLELQPEYRNAAFIEILKKLTGKRQQ